jgi:hypothetical protein
MPSEPTLSAVAATSQTTARQDQARQGLPSIRLLLAQYPFNSLHNWHSRPAVREAPDQSRQDKAEAIGDDACIDAMTRRIRVGFYDDRDDDSR